MQSKEIAEYQYKINRVYESSIKPLLEECETVRKNEIKELKKKILKQFSEILILIITALCTSGCLFYFINSTSPWILGICITIFGLCGMRSTWLIMDMICYPMKVNQDFVKWLKENMFPNLLKIFNDNLFTIKNILSDIDSENLTKSQLFLGSNNYSSSDDCFAGCHKGVAFSILETCIMDNFIKPFNGILIQLTFNKPIKNRTIIVTKNDDITNLFAFIIFLGIVLISTYVMYLLITNGTRDLEILFKLGFILFILYFISFDIFRTFKTSEDIKPVKLEDPKFNKNFKAYSSDQIEGRYLLSASFIERFNNLRTAFGAKNAKCSFYDDKLLIAVSTYKNIFEIGDLFHNLEDPKRIDKFYNEIISVIQLIDHFKLDEKTNL